MTPPRPPEAPRPPEPGIPAGATPLSRVTAPAPEVRVINVRKPPEPEEAAVDERLFAEEGSAEGCASGECLPDAPPPPDPVAAPAPTPVARAGRDNPALPPGDRWRAAVDGIRAASPRHGTALAHGRLLWLRAGEVGLAYAPTAAFHRGMVTGSTGRPQVEKMLAEHFGGPMKLVVEEASGEVAVSTRSIAEQEAQARAEHTQSTEGKVRSHPSIRAVLKHLGGEIEHIQVLEPERPPASPPAESPEESA